MCSLGLVVKSVSLAVTQILRQEPNRKTRPLSFGGVSPVAGGLPGWGSSPSPKLYIESMIRPSFKDRL